MEQEPELSIAYPVKYRFMYEPIFVARTNAPQYDEMFSRIVSGVHGDIEVPRTHIGEGDGLRSSRRLRSEIARNGIDVNHISSFAAIIACYCDGAEHRARTGWIELEGKGCITASSNR